MGLVDSLNDERDESPGGKRPGPQDAQRPRTRKRRGSTCLWTEALLSSLDYEPCDVYLGRLRRFADLAVVLVAVVGVSLVSPFRHVSLAIPLANTGADLWFFTRNSANHWPDPGFERRGVA